MKRWIHSKIDVVNASTADNQSKLYVKFQDYIDSNVKEAVFTGSDRLDALKKLADNLNVCLDSFDIEREMMSSEDVINYLLDHNGDGCDFIVKIIDESTHDQLMGYPFKDDGYPVTGSNRIHGSQDLTHLFKIGQKVKCRFDDKMHSGTVKEVDQDHIIVDVPAVSDHCWFEIGFNIEDVYPEYNF